MASSITDVPLRLDLLYTTLKTRLLSARLVPASLQASLASNIMSSGVLVLGSVTVKLSVKIPNINAFINANPLNGLG